MDKRFYDMTEEELTAEIKRRVRLMTDEQRLELLEFIKTIAEKKEAND